MNLTTCQLPGVLIFQPEIFRDDRGFFLEMWNQRRYSEAGVHPPFVQDNLSRSRKGTLRGLHFQSPTSQGKLASVLEGEVFDVVVDLRKGQPTFGESFGIHLSAENRKQMYIPPEFAHGIQVLSDEALFHYKCTEFYNPKDTFILRWDDPQLGIQWPIADPILSAKDRNGTLLKDLPRDALFD